METKSRVLIVGATGYLGKHIAIASLRSGHPTRILVRPQVSKDVHKVRFLLELSKAGATISKCSLDDHHGLVRLLKQVDVVICALGEAQVKQQYKLIEAINEAGNIKKFYPSEFGMDMERLDTILESRTYGEKIAIRRAIEAAGISYTYFTASCAMAMMLASFVQMEDFPDFVPPRDKICIYKDGQVRVAFISEEDLATYVIKSVDDARTLNRVVYTRPPGSVTTMNEQVASWEGRIGKTLEKSWLSEEQVLLHVHDPQMPVEMKEVWRRIYWFFCKGVTSFDLEPGDIEASDLYPEVKYTSPEAYLESYLSFVST